MLRHLRARRASEEREDSHCVRRTGLEDGKMREMKMVREVRVELEKEAQ